MFFKNKTIKDYNLESKKYLKIIRRTILNKDLNNKELISLLDINFKTNKNKEEVIFNQALLYASVLYKLSKNGYKIEENNCIKNYLRLIFFKSFLFFHGIVNKRSRYREADLFYGDLYRKSLNIPLIDLVRLFIENIDDLLVAHIMLSKELKSKNNYSKKLKIIINLKEIKTIKKCQESF